VWVQVRSRLSAWCGLVRGGCFGVSVALAMALAPADARADENWEAAKSAFLVCLEQFPDAKAIHSTLKAEGWRYEGNESGLRIFSRNGYRAIATTQGNSQIAARCVVSSSRLTPEAALAFAEGISKRMEGGKPIDLADRGMIAGWEGSVRGRVLRMAVDPKAEFGVMRGAMVILGEL